MDREYKESDHENDARVPSQSNAISAVLEPSSSNFGFNPPEPGTYLDMDTLKPVARVQPISQSSCLAPELPQSNGTVYPQVTLQAVVNVFNFF